MEIEIVQNTQVQFNTLQFNQEIRNTYLRKNGDKYIIKWLHMEARNEEDINKMQEHISRFNQLLTLRDTLYRSNFNIVEFVKTRENITISTEESPKTITLPFPSRFLNEKGKFNHILKK
jgi:hypothetical protein